MISQPPPALSPLYLSIDAVSQQRSLISRSLHVLGHGACFPSMSLSCLTLHPAEYNHSRVAITPIDLLKAQLSSPTITQQPSPSSGSQHRIRTTLTSQAQLQSLTKFSTLSDAPQLVQSTAVSDQRAWPSTSSSRLHRLHRSHTLPDRLTSGCRQLPWHTRRFQYSGDSSRPQPSVSGPRSTKTCRRDMPTLTRTHHHGQGYLVEFTHHVGCASTGMVRCLFQLAPTFGASHA